MTKVNLRQKAISGNRQALYLDFYPPIINPDTRKPTRREFLKLYVFEKPKTLLDKQHNKETLNLAEGIKAKRQLEIQNEQYGFLSTRKRNTCFINYFEQLTNKRKASNFDNWTSALHYLKQFTEGSLKVSELNENFCNDFKEYLLTVKSRKSEKQNLATNSAVSYFNKVKAALKQAYKDGLLTVDLNSRVEPIKAEETQRKYLTDEELQCLINTDCEIPILKQAAIFSALTGLRFSDIQKLLWEEVQYGNAEGHHIKYTQKKTKGVEVLPIPEQAFFLLGERGHSDAKVFPNLHYSAYNNTFLEKWINNAGIEKKITFHSFRHTNATLQLSLGTDLYTVSKMLGHREIKTTQGYAKVIDKTKRVAADKLKFDFSNYEAM